MAAILRAPDLQARRLSSDLPGPPIQIHKTADATPDPTLDLSPGAWVNMGHLVVQSYALAELQIFASGDAKTLGFSICAWAECLGANYANGAQGRERYVGTIVSGVSAKAATNPIDGKADSDDSWWDATSAPAPSYTIGESGVATVPVLANQVSGKPVSFVLDLLGVYALAIHFNAVPSGTKGMASILLGF